MYILSLQLQVVMLHMLIVSAQNHDLVSISYPHHTTVQGSEPVEETRLSSLVC